MASCYDLSVYGLLSVSLVIQTTSQDSSLPVQGALNSKSREYSVTRFTVIQAVALLVFLGVSYTDRIAVLYSSDPDPHSQYKYANPLVSIFTGRSTLTSVRDIMIETSRKLKTDPGVAIRKLRQRQRYLRYKYQWQRQKSAVRKRVSRILFLSQELQYAFMANLFTLLFGVVYGTSEVNLSQNNVPEAGRSGNQSKMSFGQLDPLLLMILPILAAGDVYFGKENSSPSRGHADVFIKNAMVILNLSLQATRHRGTYQSTTRPFSHTDTD